MDTPQKKCSRMTFGCKWDPVAAKRRRNHIKKLKEEAARRKELKDADGTLPKPRRRIKYKKPEVEEALQAKVEEALQARVVESVPPTNVTPTIIGVEPKPKVAVASTPDELEQVHTSLLAVSSGSSDVIGILDSGASIHMCGDRSLFVGNLKPCNVEIKCANNATMDANQCGDVALKIKETKKLLWLKNCLYVPNGPLLISVSRLAVESKIQLLFIGKSCELRDGNTSMLICTVSVLTSGRNRNLYTVRCEKPDHVATVQGENRKEQVFTAYSELRPRDRDINIIHQRYNHICEYYCNMLVPPKKKRERLEWCDSCVVGGLSKRKYKKKTTYSPHNNQTKHEEMRFASEECDEGPFNMTEVANVVLEPSDEKDAVFGKKMSWDTKTSPIVSVRGNKYAFVGVCFHTKVSVSFVGAHKYDFVPKMKRWLARYCNRFGCYPARLVFDQGGEFTERSFLNWMGDRGIEVSFSTTGGSNQNAQVERKIGVVWVSVLKLLAHSSVPFQFWCFAFQYAVLVGNHVPHKALDFKRPVEMAKFTPIDTRIFVWGCEAWHHPPNRMAHEAKAKRGVFLGLDEEIKGWQILDIETRKVIVTRNVIFNEERFPFKDHLNPCLIMLKFGTWPRSRGVENVSLKPASKDPVTVTSILNEAEVKTDPVAELGDSDDSKDRGEGDKPVIPTVHQSTPPTELQESPTELKEENGRDDSIQDHADCVNPDPKAETDNQEVLSPIPTDIASTPTLQDWDTPSLTPEMAECELEEPMTIDLDTPPLGAAAKKNWARFKDNRYLKSATTRRLKFFEDRLVRESTGLQPADPVAEPKHSVKPAKKLKPAKPKPVPLTPVPEDEYEGEPAWEILRITRSRPSNNKDGTKEYYVRWKGNWPDQWLHESQMGGSADLIADFNKPKRTYTKGMTKANTGNVWLKPKEEETQRELRRSTRLTGEVAESANLLSSEFPLPPDYESEQHAHWVPSRTSRNETINLVLGDIAKLVEGNESKNNGVETKPENRKEMLEGSRKEEFLEAERKELSELKQNGTFEIVQLPEGRKPIPCRWVYDLKRNIKGEIERFKARLVIQGFRQIEGIDYQNTFSAVSQMRSFRLLVALSVHFGLRITQYDISNAFLHAELDKEIYMTFPPGYPNAEPSKGNVFKLLKGLYGLKQASRLWNKRLAKAFGEAGLTLARTEPGVFFVKGDSMCILNLHVDDYNIATADEVLRVKVEKIMDRTFSVKPLGELSLFLGIVAEKFDEGGRVGYKLHQEPYHKRALQKFELDKCKPAKTVAEVSLKLSILDCPEVDDKGKPVNPPKWEYMSAGGTLMYSAGATRPDIAQRVMQLARYNKNPGEVHVKAQKHVLRYLAAAPGRGVIFSRPKDKPVGKEPITITAFCDSDWAGCTDSRRSTIGYVIHVAGGPVTWKSQLKKTLALSSCEAEFMALTDVAREVIWMTRFFDEIGVPYRTPRIYSDSQSAIYWTEDPVQHQRNKHVELKYYYIRDIVGKKAVKVCKINTLNNISDPLTKPATKRMTEELVPALMGEKRPTLEE